MNVIQLIEELIEREGGYVNDPTDKGGATKYGITIATLSNFLNKKCKPKDVEAITKQLAFDIYEKNYYLNPAIDKLHVLVQPIIFDAGVMSGTNRAIKILQEQLLADGHNVGIIDGVIGRKTIAACNDAIKAGRKTFINSLVARRVEFYHSIVKRDPTQSKFIKGWENRARLFLV